MFLIDKPFVSDFLIKTIKDNNFKIIATKQAKELISDNTLNWIDEKIAIETIKTNPDTPIYLNSENGIAWIDDNLKFSTLPKQVQVFKDKFQFRALVKDSFPDFFYKTVELEAIQTLSLNGIDFPFVIKPSLGFFSLGVHIVHNMTDWIAAKKELNYENLKSIYPKSVLNTSTFIIEEYIEGEEYAIDCYFDDDGEVVILSILHHQFSSGTDVSDRVYSTSKDIILSYKKEIELFLTSIGNKANLKNFPAHVEVRIDSNGKISPIEVNPLRFGGWCTTADLSGYSYGINSYAYFIHKQKPDWEEIFKGKADKIYSIVILNNNSGFATNQITNFDYDGLVRDFEKVLHMRKLDIQQYPVFGFMLTETSKGNERELEKILVSDLRKYVKFVPV